MEARKSEYRVPARAPIRQCNSCHAQVVWILLGSGKQMPLSVASIRTDEQGVRWALSHFADCPNAAQHRRARAATIEAEPDHPAACPNHPTIAAGWRWNGTHTEMVCNLCHPPIGRAPQGEPNESP